MRCSTIIFVFWCLSPVLFNKYYKNYIFFWKMDNFFQFVEPLLTQSLLPKVVS